jgi:competence ComEA-like helix-hairpin-helix protein
MKRHPGHGWVSFGLAAALVASVTVADAAKWSRRYIDTLDDAAFAAVERSPTGKTVRHLPHHDHTGALDLPHLMSALARIDQVRWLDPGNKAAAELHLRDHLAAYKQERLAATRVRVPIDLNRATVAELAALPLVGRRRAEGIVAYRKTHGPFKAIDELRRVRGIGPVIFEAIADLVTVRQDERGT